MIDLVSHSKPIPSPADQPTPISSATSSTKPILRQLRPPTLVHQLRQHKRPTSLRRSRQPRSRRTQEAVRRAWEATEAANKVAENQIPTSAEEPAPIFGNSKGYTALTGREGGNDASGGLFNNQEDSGLPPGARCEGNGDSAKYKKRTP
jgi:hypothetical protein